MTVACSILGIVSKTSDFAKSSSSSLTTTDAAQVAFERLRRHATSADSRKVDFEVSTLELAIRRVVESASIRAALFVPAPNTSACAQVSANLGLPATVTTTNGTGAVGSAAPVQSLAGSSPRDLRMHRALLHPSASRVKQLPSGRMIPASKPSGSSSRISIEAQSGF